MADKQKLEFNRTDDEINILLACTGSVAALEIPSLIQKLQNIKISKDPTNTNIDSYTVNVRVVITERAKHFFTPENVPVIVYEDKDEWTSWKKRTDPVLHIELRRWADIMIIAPLSANTLAKLANGLCDNLLTLAFRAWDLQKPVLFATAMNTYMWESPLTKTHMQCLKKDLGCEEIPCIEKLLMCGDIGMGGMADTIVQYARQRLCAKKIV